MKHEIKMKALDAKDWGIENHNPGVVEDAEKVLNFCKTNTDSASCMHELVRMSAWQTVVRVYNR